MPGAVIGVLRDGVTTAACYGVADVRTGEPVTLGTLFSVGSLTKSMVATVIVRLAEAGCLSLGDPVAAHVPELRACGWAQRASLRDLLANRSGLPMRAALEFDFAGRKGQDDSALSRLAADVAAFVPAPTFWSYTNVGWCLLGRVIETASGAAWEEAMRRHLVGAGMRETLFVTDAFTRRALGSRGHGGGSGDSRTFGLPRVRPGRRNRRFDGHGPSTLRLCAPGGPVSRGPARVHAEVSIHGWLDSWCLGWAWFDWQDGRVWGWDGVVTGERSVLRMVPDRRPPLSC